MDCRLAWRCAYDDSSLVLDIDACSKELGFSSVGTVSVVKAFGSKPKGDAVRMKPLVGRDGKADVDWSCRGSLAGTLADESGDSDDSLLGMSFIGGGEASSGFAIRRPPSD